MKLNSAKLVQDVERSSNDIAEGEFRIKTTAKAFDILSSGLYSDKILAVVRELACNALDAQTEAGTTEPFEIHLPNGLEPYFYVKDFGTGLSDEQVYGLYTTYFESTKTESNDFIGALGLGSKSPFSYTKSFQVSSRYEGTLRTYSVFINERGIPTVARMAEVPTTERNGLEVRLAVRPSDFYEFAEKTAAALKFFPTLPKIIGNSSHVWPDMPKVLVQGSNFIVRERPTWNSNVTVIQGNIPYRFDMSQFNIDDFGVAGHLLRHGNVELYFDLGQLEMSASRESIQYDPITKANIIAATQTIMRDVVVWVTNNLSSTDSLWKQSVMLNDLATMFVGRGNTGAFVNILEDSGVKHPVLDAYVELSRLGVTWDRVIDPKKILLKGHQAGNSSLRTRVYGVASTLFVNSKIAYVYQDVKRTSVRRMARWLQENRGYSLIEFIPQTDETTVADVQPLIDAIGGPELLLVSDLPDVETVPRSTRASIATDEIRASMVEVKFTRTHRRNHSWVPNVINISEGGIYVELDKTRSPVGPACNISNSWIISNESDLVNRLTALLDLPKVRGKIIGVNKKTAEKVSKCDNWFNLNDLCEQAAMRVYRYAYILYQGSNSSSELIRRMDYHKNIITKLSDELPTNSFVNKLTKTRDMLEYAGKYKDLTTMLYACGVLDRSYFYETSVVNENDEVRDILSSVKFSLTKQDEDDFHKQYPMLTLVGGLMDNMSNIDIIVDYINMIDSSTGENN